MNNRKIPTILAQLNNLSNLQQNTSVLNNMAKGGH